MRKLILFFSFIVGVGYLSAQPSSPILENPPKEADVVVLPAVLDWANVPGAECYYVEIVTDTTGPVSEESCTVTSSSFTVPDGVLNNDTKYFWRVKAHDDIEGWGNYSEYFCFTTESNSSIGSIQNLSDGVIDLIAEEQVSQVQGDILVHRLEHVTTWLENEQTFLALIHMYIFKTRLYILRMSNMISNATFEELNYSADGVIDLIVEEDSPVPTALQNNLTPTSYALGQNYPNPFNPSTNIEYSIPKSAFVTLKIYDMLGKEVKTLVSKQQDAGTFIVDWNASQLSSGVYLYRLTAGSFVETKKMILAK